MRLKIESTDRIGISQEILAVFAKRSWDLRAIEVEAFVTYVHIDETKLSLIDINRSLATIEGIKSCIEIEFLPTELKAHHMHTLLSRMPDPMIDINHDGKILLLNQAAQHLLAEQQQSLNNRVIDDFIEPSYQSLIQDKAITTSVHFLGKAYLAELTPVLIDDKINGGVLVLRTMKSLGRQISLMQADKAQTLDHIIGQSTKIKVLKEQTLRFAKLELPVLISGETGTGKELVARAIHQASARAKSPFLAINCAALPENLLESELYGYAQGAFTGAQKGGKPGLFELAEGGTIFLDEIAEMSTYLQAKLLRFLQDFRFRRLGGTKELTANVRIISASHQQFERLLQLQHFREDLFYRLNVLTLTLPPLRDRIDDIALLSQHFIESSALQVDQVKPHLTEQALARLKAFSWPGNIRQLQNILFRVVALNKSGQIEAKELNEALADFGHFSERPTDIAHHNIHDNQEHLGVVQNEQIADIQDWQSAQQLFEKSLLKQLLPHYPTTRKLAKRLGVSHNKIAMKLRKYQLQQ
ncbi:sigma 54-interacting transcriptional regulator [Thalassotalea sp. PLHSN55]|uniref:sigma 54-interacting transcriptional regulator n=1 Tax=Thalassotalea sp. PLHSN55 TaxID=3435888 RepID=UPI003F830BD4